MPGFRQIEWIIRERLRSGLQTLRDRPALVDEMFPDLSANSRTHLKQWLLTHDIAILLAYPRQLEDVPCWVISMGGASPVQTPIGEMLSHSYSSEGETTEYGELVRKTYQIFTMSQNADLTLILATILQHILKSMRRSLDIDGYYQMQVAQEGPVDLRVDLLPSYLYARITSISVMVEDSYLYVDSTLPDGLEIGFEVEFKTRTDREDC